MNQPQHVRVSLADIAARYQTIVSIHAAGSTGFVKVLSADPRRFYVRFEMASGGTTVWPTLPGQKPTGAVLTGNMVAPLEYKFRDCPSIVCGEFYSQAQMGTTMLITQCIYLG